MNTESRITPVLVEIVRNGVIAVTEEMKTNLMRTAYNMIIYEALDFTVGLFTAAGETVSISLGLPTFIRGMAETIRAKLKHFGKDGIEPGDILLTNDAYITGSHLNHMTFSLPIFHEGELIGFSCCMAHWQDVGGRWAASRPISSPEGLQVPIVKYAKKGVVQSGPRRYHPDECAHSRSAPWGFARTDHAVKSGEKRFLELVNRYGRDEVSVRLRHHGPIGGAGANPRHSRRHYEAESFMDDDGMAAGAPDSYQDPRVGQRR
jgi:N-methylhydantoinase B